MSCTYHNCMYISLVLGILLYTIIIYIYSIYIYTVYIYIHKWVWVKIRYPNNWMVKTRHSQSFTSVVPYYRSSILTHIQIVSHQNGWLLYKIIISLYIYLYILFVQYILIYIFIYVYIYIYTDRIPSKWLVINTPEPAPRPKKGLPRCQELPGFICQQLLDEAEGTFQHLKKSGFHGKIIGHSWENMVKYGKFHCSLRFIAWYHL